MTIRIEKTDHVPALGEKVVWVDTDGQEKLGMVTMISEQKKHVLVTVQ